MADCEQTKHCLPLQLWLVARVAGALRAGLVILTGTGTKAALVGGIIGRSAGTSLPAWGCDCPRPLPTACLPACLLLFAPPPLCPPGLADAAAALLALADEAGLSHLRAVALDYIVHHYEAVAATGGWLGGWVTGLHQWRLGRGRGCQCGVFGCKSKPCVWQDLGRCRPI